MAWTRHGHHIPGSQLLDDAPPGVARCGGTKLCMQCRDDVASWGLAVLATEQHEAQKTTNTPDEGYIQKARRIVYEYVKDRLEKTDTHVTFAQDEVYVVWFSKTLQNWKAILSTTLPDGMIYEVTYNGNHKVSYLDAYRKWENVQVPDKGD